MAPVDSLNQATANQIVEGSIGKDADTSRFCGTDIAICHNKDVE